MIKKKPILFVTVFMHTLESTICVDIDRDNGRRAFHKNPRDVARLLRVLNQRSYLKELETVVQIDGTVRLFVVCTKIGA
jgi:hypothetical protein